MIPVKILALQYIPNASPALCDTLGVSPKRPSLGLITTDSDDATYIALDEATKAADVTVSYGRSFYAGAANASTPYAGEVMGILSAATPGAVRSGMAAVTAARSVMLPAVRIFRRRDLIARDVAARLRGEQLVVASARRHQLGVISFLDELAVFQHENL